MKRRGHVTVVMTPHQVLATAANKLEAQRPTILFDEFDTERALHALNPSPGNEQLAQEVVAKVMAAVRAANAFDCAVGELAGLRERIEVLLATDGEPS